MFTVFVTGPLASGKRAACEYLTTKGFSHIDLDDMAKEFLDEEPVVMQLVEHYGRIILDEAGGIDRAKLATQAFAGEGASDALNSIVWPLVEARLSDVIVGNSCQFNDTNSKLAVEIAMLAEAPALLDLADAVLCITASSEIRLKRAVTRGMREEDALRRMALQASDEERAALCDAVIENNGSKEELHVKLDTWLQTLQQEQMF